MATLQSLTALAVLSTAVPISLALLGCADNGVTKPSEVTLEAGMQSVGRGLALMKAAEVEAAKTNGLSSNFNTGLMPSEATVTFNIAASASRSNQLMIDLSAPPTIPVKASGSDTFSYSASGSRANQITVRFSSLYFNTSTFSATNAAAGAKASAPSDLNDPETIKEVVGIINSNATNGAGRNIYIAPMPTK
jgi:hypothetical protein